MSRGFVREEDQEEAPFIPPRAALPKGVTNYVTPKGFDDLQKEHQQLENELKALDVQDEKERRHAKALIHGKMRLLNERINSARILHPKKESEKKVRFGAKVRLYNLQTKDIQKFQIVGVDEANVHDGKIAFIAPIARCITGKKIGETAEFRLGNETRKLEILEVSYD